MTLFYTIYAFVIGAVLCSFYNVVGLRVPNKESIIKPPSHCPHCGKRLTAVDLIPVVSFIFLRGRCRTCGAKVSFIYPFVELVTAALFAFSTLYIGWTLELIVAWALISLLVIVFVSDITYQIIPDKIVLFFAILFVLLRCFIPFLTWRECLLGAVLGFLLLLAIAIVSRGNMGGGDIKLFAVLGFVLGIKGVLFAFFFSCFYGAAIGIIGILIGKFKRGAPIPFGPYIALGVLTTYFYGEWIWNWYLHLF